MNNFKEIINGEIPTLVDFYAAWCGPCKAMHPILEQLKQRMGEGVRIVKIDVDSNANRQLTASFQIRNIPTMILFRKGEVIWKKVGATDLETLLDAIKKA